MPIMVTKTKAMYFITSSFVIHIPVALSNSSLHIHGNYLSSIITIIIVQSVCKTLNNEISSIIMQTPLEQQTQSLMCELSKIHDTLQQIPKLHESLHRMQ